jgi:hypothetical protein
MSSRFYDFVTRGVLAAGILALAASVACADLQPTVYMQIEDMSTNPPQYLTSSSFGSLPSGISTADNVVVAPNSPPPGYYMSAKIDSPTYYTNAEGMLSWTGSSSYHVVFDWSSGFPYSSNNPTMDVFITVEGMSHGDDSWSYVSNEYSASGHVDQIFNLSGPNDPLMIEIFSNGDDVYVDNLTVTAVPLPPTVLLLGTGLIPLVWSRRRKKLAE